ncbi:50S ribosomal protein L18 [Aureibaculum marinum]|uniref:Large ribosomal subunit protein uL18 n=1 Tax=Aureibaculum marinum TaxID=2487930 RepID=A0A3N4P8S2_9FLAO|nr:50S ribosomal protein L18 [Aureibaculum marinum]RPE00110.1 50S ribosomal protein L18 [Aureibaculum marinum]
MALSKLQRRNRIKQRIRKVVSGTAEKPRLSVYRSNKEIDAQLIDDITGNTLVAVSSRDKKIEAKGTKTEVALAVGKALAEKATKSGITNVCFDRNGYLYHGRVKALADGAREGGLKF